VPGTSQLLHSCTEWGLIAMFEGQVAFYLNKYLGVFMSMYCVLMFVYCVFFQWCLPFVMHAQQATSLLYLLP